MQFFDKFLARFRNTQTAPTTDDTFEELVWLEPHENPFGVRVLDLRPKAETMMSATDNPSGISFFGSAASQSGDVFRGRQPDDAIQVACNLEYPITAALPEGPLFLASVMEEKWNIYHFDGVLYFARSWTGELHYVARTVEVSSRLSVMAVEAWSGCIVGEVQMVSRQIDFLIKSHVFDQAAPHPVPILLPSKKAIALWSFSQYGRRGLFALPEVEAIRAGDSPSSE